MRHGLTEKEIEDIEPKFQLRPSSLQKEKSYALGPNKKVTSSCVKRLQKRKG